MKSKTLFVYNSIKLFEILKEVKSNLNFDVDYLDKETYQKKNFSEYKDYLIITTENSKSLKNFMLIEGLPIKIDKLIEKINLRFLKNQFVNQSDIKIGKYILNLNSRKIGYKKLNLDLTEKECDLLLFIQSHKRVNLKEIQKKVWHYNSDLETHTVETHIYRIRKKMIEKFEDNNFIKFDKEGYYLS
tara:strand:- start:549 stop:1109 length:561 start_codon:yes stop_codon:yes gene_type:complete